MAKTLSSDLKLLFCCWAGKVPQSSFWQCFETLIWYLKRNCDKENASLKTSHTHARALRSLCHRNVCDWLCFHNQWLSPAHLYEGAHSDYGTSLTIKGPRRSQICPVTANEQIAASGNLASDSPTTMLASNGDSLLTTSTSHKFYHVNTKTTVGFFLIKLKN